MTRCDLDADLRQLAGRQRGVLSRRQATTLGVDRWSLERRLATGSWELVTKRVVRLVGSPETFEQRCLVGVLFG